MIKKLSKSIREYKLPAIMTPVFVVLEVIMEIIIPFLLAKLIDEGIAKGQITIIYKMGALLFLCATIALISSIIAGLLAGLSSCGFAKNLRHDIYYKVNEYSFSNIDKFSPSGIVTRMTTDVNNLQMAFQMVLKITFRAPFTIIFALLMAFRINKQISLGFLLIGPVITLGMYLIIRTSRKYFDKVYATYDKLNNVVSENVRGMRVVKSYVMEDTEIKKFKKVSLQIYQYFTKAEKIVAFNSPLMKLVMHGCILCVSYFSAKYIIAGIMTTGQLTSLITYALQILINLMMISMIIVLYTIAGTSAKRVVSLLDEEPSIKNCPHPIKNISDGSISFQDVNFSYTNDLNKLCLKNINLEIKSGECIGIIGITGSAKSSLVQLIPRLYDTTSGVVMVGGHNVKDYDIQTLRQNIAMVLQKNTLFKGTIKDNLKWGNENASLKEIQKVSKIAVADTFIEDFAKGYDTYIEQGGSNVSGGQKQRLCIARALLKKPKILILDDSTSSVDTKTDQKIRSSFKSEIKDVTKIIISGRIDSIQDCDRIIVMNDGKIDGIGTHSSLIKDNDLYREIYETQKKGVISHA